MSSEYLKSFFSFCSPSNNSGAASTVILFFQKHHPLGAAAFHINSLAQLKAWLQSEVFDGFQMTSHYSLLSKEISATIAAWVQSTGDFSLSAPTYFNYVFELLFDEGILSEESSDLIDPLIVAIKNREVISASDIFNASDSADEAYIAGAILGLNLALLNARLRPSSLLAKACLWAVGPNFTRAKIDLQFKKMWQEYISEEGAIRSVVAVSDN